MEPETKSQNGKKDSPQAKKKPIRIATTASDGNVNRQPETAQVVQADLTEAGQGQGGQMIQIPSNSIPAQVQLQQVQTLDGLQQVQGKDQLVVRNWN